MIAYRIRETYKSSNELKNEKSLSRERHARCKKRHSGHTSDRMITRLGRAKAHPTEYALYMNMYKCMDVLRDDISLCLKYD